MNPLKFKGFFIFYFLPVSAILRLSPTQPFATMKLLLSGIFERGDFCFHESVPKNPVGIFSFMHSAL